jgi:ribonuclease D
MSAITITVEAPVYVTDNAILATLCEQWQQLPLIALDTEFVRVDTFYPRLGLIQVGDGVKNYLLDPLVLSEWDGFIALLSNQAVTKVLHSCSEDLVVFKDFFQQLPTPLFDSQRAAAFLGFGYSISYQNLVKEVLDIEVSKDQTRSDWTRRPLTEEQCNYAALDVAYLPAITQFLKDKLAASKRSEWAEDEFTQMLTAAAPEPDAASWQDYYLSLGGAWRLDATQLGALQRLCEWREEQARGRNKPRSWIAKDAELLAIATAMPRESTALAAIADLPRPLVSRDGADILAIIKAPQKVPAPRPDLTEQPLDAVMRKSLKVCQGIVRQFAEQLGIAPELLARKKQLLPLIYAAQISADFPWPNGLSGWRQALLEDPMRTALKKGSSK